MIACALLLTLGLHAQQHEVQYGVHVRAGSSSSASVSSNIGDTCYATGYYSFAGGHKSYAQGACSFAYGNMSYATQSNAYAMGNMANASGANSLSLGFYTQANQNGSTGTCCGGQATWMPVGNSLRPGWATAPSQTMSTTRLCTVLSALSPQKTSKISPTVTIISVT